MSVVGSGRDGIETLEEIEQNIIIQRASVEPDDLNERARLLGHSKRPVPKRVMVLLTILTIFILCIAATATAEIDVIYRFICYFEGIPKETCLASEQVNSEVAKFLEVSTILSGSMSLISATYLSVLSDRAGRRPIFLATIVLATISRFVAWYVVFRLDNPLTYWILLVPVVVENLGGGTKLVMQLAVAYMSDMVPNVEHRTRLVSYCDGVISGCLAIGPSLGSFIIKRYSLETLYVMSFLGGVLAIVLSVVFLGESLSSTRKRHNSTNKVTVMSSFSLLKFAHLESPTARRNAWLLFLFALITREAIGAFIGVILLFPRRMFGWTAVELGYLISMMSVIRTFIFVLGFPYLYSKVSKICRIYSDRLDRADLLFIRTSLIFSVLGLLFMGWSKSSGQFYAAGVLDAMSALGRSVFTSAMIKYLPDNQYGAFMAIFGFISSVCGVVSPTLVLQLYTWASEWRPYLPYEVMSALYATLLVSSLFTIPAI